MTTAFGTRTPGEIDALVKKLDLAGKVRLLTGAAAFSLHEEPSIGLARVDVSDGPTGVRGLKFVGGPHVVLFPSATVLASSWDDALLEEVGDIVGDEAERQGIATVLGPTINLHRSPLGGRLFEQYSEDPLLTGRLAAHYTLGLQQHHVGACLKHWLANESETERNTVNSVVDERTLREVYMLPFEIAIEQGDPWMIMASYNRVNGTAATEHTHLLREVLREAWGWEGVVVSDWFATRTATEAANGGLDLVMPGPDGPWGKDLVAAVEHGEVPEEVIDEKVRRILTLADRAGLLGQPRQWRTDIPAPDSPQRAEEMTRIAAAGMTLLKNDGVLPLQPGTNVAAIGRPVVRTVVMGGGSATVNAPYERSIADGLDAVKDRWGDVVVVDGVEIRERGVPAEPGFLTDPTTGEPGIRARYLDADGTLLGESHTDLTSVAVGFDDDFERPVATVELSAAIARGGDLEIGAIGTGTWTLQVGEHREEFVLRTSGHDPGEAMLKPPYQVVQATVADGATLTGVVRLGGENFSTSGSDNATLDAVNAAGAGPKGFIARPTPRPVDDVLAEAVQAAAAADVAVVAVGLTEERETEAVDKTTLALPGEQDRLVREVAAAASRTVVVVNASTPILMPWEDDVDAVLVVGLPGQDGGDAVAKVLVGELEPAGRLVTTWPAADGASPGWAVIPDGNNDLHYNDGTFIGYRGHAPYGKAPAPAHWLGEGLGYGSFRYENVELLDGPSVRLTVHNDDQRDSQEVVQVYLRPSDPAEPVRLAGYTKVDVPAGGSTPVTVTTDQRLWRVWDPATKSWGRLAHGGELLVARGLGDVRARLPLA